MKKLIRKVVGKLRHWLYETPPYDPYEGEQHRLVETGYCRINCELLEMVNSRALGHVRPHFAWGVLNAAYLARALGYKRISAIEFGVAGGAGLISLEETCAYVGNRYGIQIDVYGFDTGTGLPPPKDFRDMPNIYSEGTYQMDEAALRRRLKHAELILGDVRETVVKFTNDPSVAPVGFASIDVDYYSSTKDVLKLFCGSIQVLMPRVHLYFDDVIGHNCANFLGERLAIEEFNELNDSRFIEIIHGLRFLVPKRFRDERWTEQMYMAQILDHKDYTRNDGMIIRPEYPLTA